MDKDTKFETAHTTIDLEKVAAFEEATPTTLAAGGAPEQALNVYLTNGRAVSVRGDDEVQGFVEALEAHLEE